MLPESRKISEVSDPGVLVLYGMPKTGKSTIVNALENNLILDLEKGTKYLNSLSVNIIGIKPPKEKEEELKARHERSEYYLTEVGKEIVTKNIKYDFITLDTVTEFEDMIVSIATDNYKASSMGGGFEGKSVLELARGAGYYWLREAYKEWIGKLMKLTPRLILIGHVKDAVANKAGKEVSAKDLDLTGKIRNITAGLIADSIGYVYRGENSELRISFKTSEELMCGSRCKHLKGKDIKIADYDVTTNELVNIDWSLVYPDKCKK